MAADKDDEQKPQAGPADALREAVERTFREAAGNLTDAGSRAQGLLDDAAAAIARLRESSAGGGDQAAVAGALEALTARVDALALRVDQLESATAAKPVPAKTAAKPKAKAKAKAKPAATTPKAGA